MTSVGSILEMFAGAGRAAYFGESVSQTEHALQSAQLARSSGANDELIVAALLHDIGHIIRGLPENIARHGVDDRHEEIGAAWLERHFGPGVTAPVRLHVPAKRYLCATDPNYLQNLSPASQVSLRLQGGTMSLDETRSFEQSEHFAAAIALRRFDDEAKIAGLDVPGLETYRTTLLKTQKPAEDLT